MAGFLTLNVNGLRDPNKHMSFLQWLSQLSVDFVCLQETHVSLESECSSWFSSFGFLSLASPGTAHSCGSVLLYRLRYVLCGSFLHSAGHFIRADFFLNNVRFHVVCVYAPNRNLAWEDFFQFVLEHVDPGSPLSSAGTSILFLTDLGTGVVSLLLFCLMIPLGPSLRSLRTAVLSMSGATFT